MIISHPDEKSALSPILSPRDPFRIFVRLLRWEECCCQLDSPLSPGPGRRAPQGESDGPARPMCCCCREFEYMGHFSNIDGGLRISNQFLVARLILFIGQKNRKTTYDRNSCYSNFPLLLMSWYCSAWRHVRFFRKFGPFQFSATLRSPKHC